MKKFEYQIFKSKSGVCYVDVSRVNFKPFENNKVVSLFTGAGGLDIGLEKAGFKTSVCVEIDPDCRETLRYNRPEWRLFEDGTNRIPGDIRQISTEELLEFSGIEKDKVALVVGGPPCQPFSNIGKKNGKDDQKNGNLFIEFVRVVKEISPQGFIYENVAGILQKKHADVIQYITQNLYNLGYNISYAILNAADYGVTQKRARLFILGIKKSEINPAFPLPTHAKNIKEWTNFVKGLDKKIDDEPQKWIPLGEVLKQIPKNAKEREDFLLMNISEVVQERMKFVQPGENFKVLPMELRPKCWRSGRHQGQDTFGRLRLDEPSVTIRTAAYNPSKGMYIHPNENRGLSTVEMAMIQSFPYEWKFKCVGYKKPTLVSISRQIGNAVPPTLAKALGLALKIQLS